MSRSDSPQQLGPGTTLAVLIRPKFVFGDGWITIVHVDNEGREEEIDRLMYNGPGGAPDLSSIVQREIALGNKGFILDYTNASWLGSAGLVWLIRCWEGIKRAGGASVFVTASKRVLDVLEVTQLTNIFEVRESVSSGLHYLDSIRTRQDT